jgi:hypothetical protein
MNEVGEVRADVIDLQAARRLALEDEQLRLLATAVGAHPLPAESAARVEAIAAELAVA